MPRAARTSGAYDLLNRETGETWRNSAGTQVNLLTFTYDANNNLLTAANNAGTITMPYDSLDRRSTSKDTSGTVLTYSYDVANNRTAIQDSFGSTTTWTYDLPATKTPRAGSFFDQILDSMNSSMSRQRRYGHPLCHRCRILHSSFHSRAGSSQVT
jgi:YD repeat-containing protein